MLKRVAGIVEKSRIGICRHACELSHGQIKIPPAGVDSENHLKSQAAERRSYVFCVVFWIEKNEVGILVLGVADDERYASLCAGRSGRKQCQEGAAQSGDPG